MDAINRPPAILAGVMQDQGLAGHQRGLHPHCLVFIQDSPRRPTPSISKQNEVGGGRFNSKEEEETQNQSTSHSQQQQHQQHRPQQPQQTSKCRESSSVQ